VTTNMAVALAQHALKVIIIEADMRRPGIRRMLNVSNEVGLSNVLAGSCKSDQAIHRGVYAPLLDILPAGPRPPLPAELLGSPAFDELLTQLRARYDLVLIDCPPALVVTDAVAISLKSDAVIWVAMSEVVTRPQLTRASRLIERDGMPVIGFVVNRIRKTAGGYGYGYQYDFSGSYYGEDMADGA
jgi:capsular exopolysaccharide synthesis family protein